MGDSLGLDILKFIKYTNKIFSAEPRRNLSSFLNLQYFQKNNLLECVTNN
uniref:Uncharacterized protein n=1 Tax=Meloidogyne enterolobii TaxID=390850 RepID=A0A6V7VZU7_MELEN|nr:unnamed protein product [Meloidogyne enterolobii]